MENSHLGRVESLNSLTDASGHLLPKPLDEGEEPYKEVTYKANGPRESEDTQLELLIVGPKHRIGCAKFAPALRCLVPYRCQDE
ncbi:hypothetical protein RvY_01491 [Ramazzottius varieornatus]|uniref:Uncharacterized protein n=1 Tax=Ramazzottius varieornatus TaxID=947166 RepID=A0A1D1UR85_RAMVA|nr:hypothetical protein RvY_01491 [Ramazzottius varieornatus]